eukprot:scaffold19037_cov23-Tisochrysis_lutea.AAC.1
MTTTVRVALHGKCVDGCTDTHLTNLGAGLIMIQPTFRSLQVHDDLVGKQGADPASDAYYSALESQVQHAFPEKWAMHSVQVQQHAQQQRQQHHQWHQASNERVAGMPRRAHNSHHTRPAFIGAGSRGHSWLFTMFTFTWRVYSRGAKLKLRMVHARDKKRLIEVNQDVMTWHLLLLCLCTS